MPPVRHKDNGVGTVCRLVLVLFVYDVLEVGQVIPVKLIEVDRTGGRLSLSYIDAIDPDGESKAPARRPSVCLMVYIG